MKHYIAFLRAINVGGHTVRMESLRTLFESLGFSEVETFIASGNLLFTTTAGEIAALEAKISVGLQKALGYEVAAFIRSMPDLVRIAAYQPFPQSILETVATNNIIFLHHPLDRSARQKLMALTSEIDSFATCASEVYWCCRRKQSQSTFSNAVLEKTLGIKSTIRGVNTIQKLAARLKSAVLE